MALYADDIGYLIGLDHNTDFYFVGVFAADAIPRHFRLPAGFIVNLDNTGQDGSHWVGIWVDLDGEHATYFDSYGLPPLNRHISSFLSMFETKLNGKKFQHLTSKDCGYYTILFIVLSSRGYSLSAIQYLFYESVGRINDKLVKDYIKFFTGLKSIKSPLKHPK